MTFKEVEEYLYGRLPTFQNQGASALNYKLDKILNLCAKFDHPQEKFKTIHVAGTNGKGSVSHGLASVMMENGLKVGLYTSPHIYSFTERVKINGVSISEDWVVSFVEANKSLIESSGASFFEITVLLSFLYFEEHEVDVAIIEVGLGGRFDSTNIINPELSIITNIGLDHTDILGDTLPKIAFEKAGVIKNETPVVIGERQPEVESVFLKKALAEKAPLFWASDLELEISHKPYGAINDRTVTCAIEVLNQEGWGISEVAITEGLSRVELNSGIVGRWQVLSEAPKVICDAAHNMDGFKRVSEWLNSYTHDLIIILGMVQEKDHRAVLRLLPESARYIFCTPSNDRGIDGKKLKSIADDIGLNSEYVKTVNDALLIAKSEIQEQGTIFVGGSNFTIADIELKYRS